MKPPTRIAGDLVQADNRHDRAMAIPLYIYPVTSVGRHRVVTDRRVVITLVLISMNVNPDPCVVVNIIILYNRGHGGTRPVCPAINTSGAVVYGIVSYP